MNERVSASYFCIDARMDVRVSASYVCIDAPMDVSAAPAPWGLRARSPARAPARAACSPCMHACWYLLCPLGVRLT
jgi:hypothetical protein